MSLFQAVPTTLDLNGPILSYTTQPVGVAVTTGGTATTPALANGTAGQLVTFVLDVDGGGNSVITPTTKSGFTAATLTDVGDSATMIYTATRGWVAIAAQAGSAGGGDAILG